MQLVFKKIVQSFIFQNIIIVTIILASIIVGLETEPIIVAKYGSIFNFLDHLILGIFVAESIIKIGAEGKKPWRYFQNGWNIFDFLIVISLLLTENNSYFVLLRMVRVLRVFKLITAVPSLQIIITALIKSIPSMGYVMLILSMLFYVYGVAGVFLFRSNDPVHFSSLPLAILSLFRIITLEDWTDIMYIQMYGCAKYGYNGIEELCTNSQSYIWLSPLFFCSFVLFGAMIVINLFVGIITSNIVTSVEEFESQQEKKIEMALKYQEDKIENNIHGEVLTIQEQLNNIQSSLDNLKKQLNNKQ